MIETPRKQYVLTELQVAEQQLTAALKCLWAGGEAALALRCEALILDVHNAARKVSKSNDQKYNDLISSVAERNRKDREP